MLAARVVAHAPSEDLLSAADWIAKGFLLPRCFTLEGGANDTVRALSVLVPTALIDWQTPSTAQWSPNICKVYTLA